MSTEQIQELIDWHQAEWLRLKERGISNANLDKHQRSATALHQFMQQQFTKSEQAYQVIGALSHHFDAFEHPDVQRALDYFSNDEYDPEFLPWVMK